ncbi:MAG: guanylate kinase [Bacteroidota bacterium]|nr:guanylate kinase [Bacteroidota bacterium]
MDKKLVILSGPSGSGKTTVAHHLLDKMSNLRFSISATTRTRRDNEKQGKDYHFLTNEEFEIAIARKDLIEYQEVYKGIYYGTLNSELNRIWDARNFPLLDIDVMGALNIKENIVPSALSIFLHPISIENLKSRLSKRATETEESYSERIEKAEQELNTAPKFDKIIYNDSLEMACQQAEDSVREYLSK